MSGFRCRRSLTPVSRPIHAKGTASPAPVVTMTSRPQRTDERPREPEVPEQVRDVSGRRAVAVEHEVPGEERPGVLAVVGHPGVRSIRATLPEADTAAGDARPQSRRAARRRAVAGASPAADRQLSISDSRANLIVEYFDPQRDGYGRTVRGPLAIWLVLDRRSLLQRPWASRPDVTSIRSDDAGAVERRSSRRRFTQTPSETLSAARARGAEPCVSRLEEQRDRGEPGTHGSCREVPSCVPSIASLGSQTAPRLPIVFLSARAPTSAVRRDEDRRSDSPWTSLSTCA